MSEWQTVIPPNQQQDQQDDGWETITPPSAPQQQSSAVQSQDSEWKTVNPQPRHSSEQTPTAQDSGDESSAVGTFFSELAGPTLLGGVRDAVQSVLDLPEDFGITGELPDLPEVPEPTTMGGRMARDVTQFLTGFVPIFGWLGKAGRIGSVARGVLAGAAADFSVFDGQEQRLSNLVQEHPAIANPVTEFLAADAEDPAIVGRLKNTLEGAALGGLTDGLLAGLRTIKAARAGRTAVEAGADPKAVKEAVDAATRKPTPIERIQTPPEGTAPPQGATVPETATSLTPEDLLRPIEPDTQIRAAGRSATEPTREVRVAGNINLDRLESLPDMENALTVIAREQGGFEETRAVGREAGTQRTQAVRGLLDASTARLMEVTRKTTQGASDADLAEWAAVMQQQLGVQRFAAGKAAEASAQLSAYKEMRNVLAKQDLKKIRGVIESMGGRDMLEQKAGLLSTLDDLEAVQKTAPKLWEAKRIDKALEAWRAGLLTGVRTHFANIGSNALVAAYAVPERLLGSAFGRMSSGEKIYAREAIAFANGALKAMRKGASDAWQVFWREGAGEDAAPGFIRRNVPGLTDEPLPTGTTKSGEVGRKIAIEGPLGYGVRTVFRGLDAADVWFKTVNFAGEAEALALRKALSEGVEGPALKDRVASILAEMPDDIAEAANKRANANTFTTPLHEQEGLISDLAGSISKFTGKHPAFGFIAPFIRTPANIFKFAAERSPGGFFMRDMQKALKAGGAARQEAMAKVALGSSLMATMMGYAAQGRITGNGPTDPNKRRWWREDHQPYSIKVGDTWYSYARFEPLGTLIGVAADMQHVWDRAGKDEWNEFAMMGAIAAANVMTSKTFMQGPVSLIEAMNDPERFGDRFVEGLVSSTVPTLAADTAKAIDPVLRDTRGVVDAWLNRVPGASGNLQPLLNRWGEEIKREGGPAWQMLSPVYKSSAADDPLAEEILRLDMAPGMPRRQINGHDLTPEQYTEYVKLSGKPAKQVLQQMIADPGWKDIPDSVQRDLISARIQTFARVAQSQMIAKYPELAVPADLQQQAKEMGAPIPPADRKTSQRTPAQSEWVAANAGLAGWLSGGQHGKPAQPDEVEQRIAGAVKGLVAARDIGAPGDVQGVDTDRALRMVADPSGLLDAVTRDAGPLAGSDPEAYTAQVQASQRAAQYLSAQIPQSPDPITSGASEKNAIPEYERESWARAVSAVANPMGVIDGLSKGRVDIEGLDAVREVYPETYARLRSEVAATLATDGGAVSYERRMAIADLLGPELEPTLDPGFMAAMQQTFAQPDPQQGMPGSYGASRNSSQTLTPRQQRRKSRNISLAMGERMGSGEDLMTPVERVAQT